jgi:glutamate-5-semialdehyde dehydrogenase
MGPQASASIASHCAELGRRARTASRLLSVAGTDRKNEWLHRVAAALDAQHSAIARVNEQDLQSAKNSGLAGALVDRLRLDADQLRAAVAGLMEIARLPDPIGRVRDRKIRPNGLEVVKLGVPLGVIFFIYESRPNVTVDGAALCVKSGNAVILRGGTEAAHSNEILVDILRDCLARSGLPPDAIQLVETSDREAVGVLLGLTEHIDLVIPRGGEDLIRRVTAEARMPVLKHYRGNCHIYVDCAADLDMAERIVINAKCQRPGVCNAAESLLVHAGIADAFLPRIAAALRRRGVQMRGCPQTLALVPGAVLATEEDHAAEFLDLIVSIKVVEDVDAAIEHISRYGSQHSDAIVTGDMAAARRFAAAVDSSAVLINASTRFNDGFELGLGAEIGISTDKFHARGPCGLEELTTYKYVVYGDGQIRGPA